MTPYGEFVALYMMREHSIINLDRSNPQLVWFVNHFEMNCQALESMDVDCTEVHKAIRDVQDAADRLHRVTIEKQLVFFTTQEASISEHLKDYIHGLRLFLDKPADESMSDFEERFKKALSDISTTATDAKEEEQEEEDQVVAGVSADSTNIDKSSATTATATRLTL